MRLTPLSQAAGPSGLHRRRRRDRLALAVGSGPRGALLLGAAILFALPGPLAGQGAEGDCDVPDHRGVEYTSQSNGYRIALFYYPTIRCSGGTWINADSPQFVFNRALYITSDQA